MTPDKITEAAARHGLRVTSTEPVIPESLAVPVVLFGNAYRLEPWPAVDRVLFDAVRESRTLVGNVDLDTAIAAIARDIDEIAAVRVEVAERADRSEDDEAGRAVADRLARRAARETADILRDFADRKDTALPQSELGMMLTQLGAGLMMNAAIARMDRGRRAADAPPVEGVTVHYVNLTGDPDDVRSRLRGATLRGMAAEPGDD